MKHPWNVMSYFTATLVGASLLLVTSARLHAEAAFPGQPHINNALKQLTIAQEAILKDSAKALAALEKAHSELETSAVGKGSYRVTAIRLTRQAIDHLSKDGADLAAKEINDAIDNVNKAGDVGARRR